MPYQDTSPAGQHFMNFADLARLADALEAGFDYVEATFADAGGHTRLILQGDGDVLQFACYDSADAVLPWLQGDAGRLAFARNVRSLLND